MNDKELKAILASYARSTLAGVLALYMAGVTDLGTLAYSLIAAVAPVVLRALNPNDPAFGRLPKPDLIEDLFKNIEVKRATAKKAPAKKVAAKKAPAKKATTKKK